MLILQITQDQLQIMLTTAAKEAVDQVLLLAKDLQPERELTRRQIKEEYSVSYPTIHRAMNDGKLSFYRVGGRVMYKETDVQKIFLKPIPAREFIKIKK
jgi:excisionase family DNA binding protein